MQRILLIVFAAGSAIAGGLAYHFHSELSAKELQIAALTVERDAARSAEKTARNDSAPLRENVERLIAERDRLKSEQPTPATLAADSAKPAPAPPEPGKPEDGAKGMMGGMAKMFQTEEGKKMLRSQTGMMIKMQYADLARKLKLSPQESEQIMNLITDRQVAQAGDGFAAFSGGSMDEAKMKEIGEKADASRKEYDAKMKAVLGDERFEQMQGYDRTIGERMMLGQIEPQFNAAGAPLAAEQKDQLLQIMSEERAKLPPTPFDANSKNPSAALNAMQDEATVDRWLKQEQDYQQRVLQAATKALNPDQINTLQQGFQQMSEMQKFGLKMSREMFKGGAKVDGVDVQVVPAPR